jgi:hypothetical protein
VLIGAVFRRHCGAILPDDRSLAAP